ncbi:hypothetical protein PsAD2_03344 [Pseudovibrio axinellae]|uniref:Lipoprotein n=1 Tax=Pseudovibrio axinellae TaxID=989403 RepID=A0A165WNC2_9HYPH|nr:hypothetical protein PsAD2_03344 [Pseudovibrio axinellae]SEQ77134.1 hypothetical protein SAMN05421798_104166 [Pseudovibrio axinellae]
MTRFLLCFLFALGGCESLRIPEPVQTEWCQATKLILERSKHDLKFQKDEWVHMRPPTQDMLLITKKSYQERCPP